MNTVNVYLANLAVLNVKLHNLHWNVVGKSFVQVHEFTEELYTALFSQFDDVAELLKMRDVFPPSSLAEYLNLTTLSELPAKNFSEAEVVNVLASDLKAMLSLAEKVRAEADAADDYTLVAAFEDIIAGYHKNLWFIKAMQA